MSDLNLPSDNQPPPKEEPQPTLPAPDLQETRATPPPEVSLQRPPSEEERVLAAIDFEGLLTFLSELVAIPSLGGTPEENSAQSRVAAKLISIGMEVDRWQIDIPALSQHPAYTVEIQRDKGLGVVGSWGGENGRSLILNGHTDVVPVGELGNWTLPPWEATLDREKGLLYGRGTLDMKGGLACAIFAVKALIDAGIELTGKVSIQSVIGEEDGGLGTLAAIARGHRADAAIVVEPTDLKISPAQAGALNFRVILPGKAAHGAQRLEGVDPLEKFLSVYRAILTFEKVRNQGVTHPLFEGYELPYPICVGTIRGGVWASTVAESLSFEGRLGVAIDEEVTAAKEAFEGLIAQVAASDAWLTAHPPQVEWWGAQFAPASIPEDHPIVQTVGDAYQIIQGDYPQVVGMPYGADMRLLVNEADIPTVLFGPGDVRTAHQPDESIALTELEAAVRILALTVLRFCR